MNNQIKKIPAIRLLRKESGESYFEKGKVQPDFKIKATEFWFANETDPWQVGTHTAPRKQFVVTISGKLKFTTSDELSFIVEPGIVFLAEDIDGEGHTWEMIEGHENWHRIYIPIVDNSTTSFIKD